VRGLYKELSNDEWTAAAGDGWLAAAVRALLRDLHAASRPVQPLAGHHHSREQRPRFLQLSLVRLRRTQRCLRTIHVTRPLEPQRRPLGFQQRSVVAQVEFEKHVLKPGLICKGKGLKPVAFKLWVNRVQCVEPRRSLQLSHSLRKHLFFIEFRCGLLLLLPVLTPEVPIGVVVA
jgi:hypothetical protein